MGLLVLIESNRLGNWYIVQIQTQKFNVLIQKDKNSIVCKPSSVLVFDEEFNKVTDNVIIEEMENMMENMNWETDELEFFKVRPS